MHNTVFASALTLALAVSGAAFAQSAPGAPAPPSPPNAAKDQTANRQTPPTIDMLKQDLQKAGFTEVKVLEDAFLIQAKTKDGNPIMMTIGPYGVRALEVSNPSGAGQPRTTGQALPSNTPASVLANPAPH
jgi:hypothetical protein